MRSNLTKRLEALEQNDGRDSWHCVLRYSDQTLDQAIAANPSEGRNYVVVNKPFPTPASA